MSSDLTIRPVARQDFEQWLPLWDGYNAFYGRSGSTALDPEVTRMTWQRFFDAYEPVHGLVAESGGELLGLVHYLFHRSTTAIQPSCYLQDLFTASAARGTGGGAGADQRRLRARAAGGIAARVLADSRDQSRGHAALRQGGGALRISGLSKDAV